MVRKVMTFKSGKFAFSKKYSNEKLSHSMIEARILYETVVDLPILPQLATRLQQNLIRKSIFGTAALEGNPLTEEEVGNILAEPDNVALEEKAEREIQNLKAAYNLVSELKSNGSGISLTEDLVKRFHGLITAGVKHEKNNPGHYRNHLVRIGDSDHGGVYTPPKCLADIETLMKEYISWINSNEILELEVEYRAALAHYYLGLIHPFGDGNGRTARIIEALLLQASGIKYVPVMLSNYYYRKLDDYYWAFSKSIKNKENDVTPFLEFFLAGYIDSLKEIKSEITYYIRVHALRDYFDFLKNDKKITQRQHDLLKSLLDYPATVSLKDLFDISPFDALYRKVSERTARRDLIKLFNEDLLIVSDDGKYMLNLHALG